MAINPYQAPSERAFGAPVVGFSGANGHSLRREGDEVICAVQGAEFPDRCVVCNAPANGFRLERKVSWHPRWVFAFAVSPIIYVIVAMITRKYARLRFGLCSDHQARRKKGMVIGGVCGVLGLAAWLGAALAEAPIAIIVGFVVMMGGGIYFGIAQKTVTPQRIDKTEARLKTGAPFLESL